MKIPFDIPHVFQSGSNPDENQFVKNALNACVEEITQGSSKTRVVPTLKKSGKTQVTFDLPYVFNTDSNPSENATALQALLRCLCEINTYYLRMRPETAPLYHSGVIYDRTTVWDSIPALYGRQYGDCKSLTCALIAEYIVQGIPARPVFRFEPPEMTDGGTNFHILVLSPYGWDDPSKILGMGQNENAYFHRRTG
jgi:hypothetical protein